MGGGEGIIRVIFRAGVHGRAPPTKGISFSLVVPSAVCMDGRRDAWLVVKKKNGV